MINTNKPKIAFLGNNITPGGGSASLYLLVKSINSSAFDKYVYASTCRSEEMKNNFLKHCHKVTVVELDEICSCQTFDTPNSEFEKIKKRSDKLSKQFLDILLHEKIDILHLNNSVFSHVTEYVKNNSSIKIISHVRELVNHNGIGELQKFILQRITNFSDKIIAISDNEAEMFPDSDKLTIMANPFDFSGLNQIVPNFRKNNHVSEDTVLVAMMGRFNYHKGHLEFLKVLKTIIDKKAVNQNFKFMIIGASLHQALWKRIAKKMLGRFDYINAVSNFIKENKLQDKLILIPYTQNVLQIVRDVDIMVRPSLHGDPWGRDIIEAMALSKPLVATGNSSFYIKDGYTGFLVPLKNTEFFAQKISELMNDREKRIEFGKNGFEKISGMCDLTGYGLEIEKMYLGLMKIYQC